MSVDHYRVPPRESLSAYLNVRFGDYPYGESLKLLCHKERKIKVAGLVDLLMVHHPNSIVHTFEVSLLVSLLGRSGDQIQRALVHDIGKTGIDPELLDKRGELTREEKKQISFHGPLGGAILRRVGLEDLAFAAEEHHVGNSRSRVWTKQELSGRHPGTEVLSLADLICAALDSRRSYHVPVQRETLLENIRKKTDVGVFSRELYQRFLDVIVAKNIFPPFKLDDYQDGLFIETLKQLGIYDSFESLITDDETARL